MLFMKVIYYTYMIILPLMILNVTWWQFAIGFVTIHLVAGFILGVIFQLAHVVEDTEHFTNKHTSVMEDAWLIHEMKTTSNFGRSNKLLCWYVGGLNFQIEHHLFHIKSKSLFPHSGYFNFKLLQICNRIFSHPYQLVAGHNLFDL